MSRRARDEGAAIGDLFAGDFFPVRIQRDLPGVDWSLRLKTALGRALKECPKSAPDVAAEMTKLLPPEQAITGDALYGFTAPSKPDHQMSILRFKAFARVTGATWLWDLLIEDEGLTIIEGREAHLAELGALQQEQARIDARTRALKAELARDPVRLGTRGRR